MDRLSWNLCMLLCLALSCEANKEIAEPNAVGMQQLLKQPCGKFSSYYSYGGSEVHPGARPWMALLKFKRNSGVDTFQCAGTLITERYVLTAASCFNTNNSLVSVRFGEHQLSTEVDCRFLRGRRTCFHYKDFDVEQIFQYADIDNEVNDIALVKMASDVVFERSIRPICLPLNQTLQESAEKLDKFALTGWGIMENSRQADALLELSAAAFSRDNCSEHFGYNIGKTELCAKTSSEIEFIGDLGSPLSGVNIYQERQRTIQYGIVSISSKGAIILTNVGSYISWIANIIGKHM